MSKPKLTKHEKAQAKVAFTLTIVALALTQLDKQSGRSEESIDNPAVQQCTVMIDELFAGKDEKTRQAMVERINLARRRLTSGVRTLGIAEGLVGALQVLTSDLFVSRPGTRFDFIRATFKENLTQIEQQPGLVEPHIRMFASEFRKAINSL